MDTLKVVSSSIVITPTLKGRLALIWSLFTKREILIEEGFWGKFGWRYPEKV